MSEKELKIEYLKKYSGRKNKLLVIAALSFLPLVYLYSVGFAPDFCVSFFIIGYIFITGLAIVIGANGLSDVSVIENEVKEKHIAKKGANCLFSPCTNHKFSLLWYSNGGWRRK